ncbi:hypothetical protein KM427_04790 [Nocardioides sp. LMS-CY]|uniref:hypothetical protein n=1 Tax=Nocardioides sp. (strain LMS-CY) TaxID=2840457 RepID=UPI001C004A47|nr:hypothetical protein [Nocardioides sp. LMS-CY]QWF23051.1 hypothetical protein KM427_04790 [Nocardioides sp. LMS-CY]
MTRRTHRLLALGTAAALAVAGLAVPSSSAAPARTSVDRKTRVVVKWKGEKRKRVYQRTANVPGIGRVDLVCRPKSTMVRVRPNNRRAETQMWLAKFEQKRGRDVVAVKNARVFTYATAADDGRGGTGPRAHEGLNQRTPIEDFSSGTAYGVISQRPGRDQPGGGALTTPVTSFQLSWWWERFRYPGNQYCRMALSLRTQTDGQFGLTWHGTDEAATRRTSTTVIPGLGEAIVTCEPGSVAYDQTVAFRPIGTHPEASYLDFEYLQGEGDVGDHVERYEDLGYDPVTGLLGPVDLPRNGMMRLWVSVDGVKRGYVLSSYYVVNNDKDPRLNLCEVAAAPLP